MRLLEHRLVVVLGKGGVGRTTISAALARAANLQGRRSGAAEFGGTGALPERLGLSGASPAFRRAGDTIVWSPTPEACFDEFLARKLYLPTVARKWVHNRFVDTFVDAVPGLNDLLVLGRIENLLTEPAQDDPHLDLLVLDAPATGHGLTLLQAARTLADLTKVGPFHDLAETIEQFLDDPQRTALVLVTLPEELPVAETLELAAELVRSGARVHTVFANLVDVDPIPEPPGAEMVLQALATVPNGGALADLVAASTARAKRHAEALVVLEDGLRELGIAAPLALPATGDLAPLAELLAEQL